MRIEISCKIKDIGINTTVKNIIPYKISTKQFLIENKIAINELNMLISYKS